MWGIRMVMQGTRVGIEDRMEKNGKNEKRVYKIQFSFFS